MLGLYLAASRKAVAVRTPLSAGIAEFSGRRNLVMVLFDLIYIHFALLLKFVDFVTFTSPQKG